MQFFVERFLNKFLFSVDCVNCKTGVKMSGNEKEISEKEKLREDVEYQMVVPNGGYGWVVALGAAFGNVRISRTVIFLS